MSEEESAPLCEVVGGQIGIIKRLLSFLRDLVSSLDDLLLNGTKLDFGKRT